MSEDVQAEGRRLLARLEVRWRSLHRWGVAAAVLGAPSAIVAGLGYGTSAPAYETAVGYMILASFVAFAGLGVAFVRYRSLYRAIQARADQLQRQAVAAVDAWNRSARGLPPRWPS